MKTDQGRGTVDSGYNVVMPSSRRSSNDARRVSFCPPYSNAKVPMDVSDVHTKVVQHLMTRMTCQEVRHVTDMPLNPVLHNFNG